MPQGQGDEQDELQPLLRLRMRVLLLRFLRNCLSQNARELVKRDDIPGADVVIMRGAVAIELKSCADAADAAKTLIAAAYRRHSLDDHVAPSTALTGIKTSSLKNERHEGLDAVLARRLCLEPLAASTASTIP